MKVTLPIKLVSLANQRVHWAVKARKAKSDRQAAYLVCKPHPLPCVVTITRVAPRGLDSDNLAISAKSLRDGIADRIGIDDRDPRVTWVYQQRKGKPKEYAVEIEINPKE